MEDIIKSISQPSWWVSVIIAGFIVNIMSAYIKSAIDKIVVHYSVASRQKKSLKDSRRAALILELASDRSRIIEMKLESLDVKLAGLAFLLMVIVFSILLQDLAVLSRWIIPVKFIFLALITALSISVIRKGTEKDELIEAAKQKTKANIEGHDIALDENNA